MLTFSVSESVVVGLKGFEKPRLFNKRQESDALPGKLLAVQVNFEIRWIKVNNFRVLVKVIL